MEETTRQAQWNSFYDKVNLHSNARNSKAIYMSNCRDNIYQNGGELVDIMQTPPKISGEPFEEYDEPTLKFASELALDIEDAMYSKLKDNKAYADKARSILFNLKDPKNPKLRLRILNGFLTPIDVVISDAK